MLQAQTSSQWHAIVVDDHSTDESYELLTNIVRNDNRFLTFKNPYPISSGPSSARNYAISLSKSPYIAFCDIDDVWHPHKLSIQLDFHLIHKLDLSVTSYARFSCNDSNKILSLVHPPTSLGYRQLLCGNPIPLSSVLLSRSLVDTHPFLSIKHEDYNLWLELFRSFPNLQYGTVPELLMFYAVHDHSLSSNKLLMPSWVYSVFRFQGFSRALSIILVIRWSFLRLLRYIITTITSLGVYRHYTISNYLAQTQPF